jgi:hypothetical protein
MGDFFEEKNQCSELTEHSQRTIFCNRIKLSVFTIKPSLGAAAEFEDNTVINHAAYGAANLKQYSAGFYIDKGDDANWNQYGLYFNKNSANTELGSRLLPL